MHSSRCTVLVQTRCSVSVCVLCVQCDVCCGVWGMCEMIYVCAAVRAVFYTLCAWMHFTGHGGWIGRAHPDMNLEVARTQNNKPNGAALWTHHPDMTLNVARMSNSNNHLWRIWHYLPCVRVPCAGSWLGGAPWHWQIGRCVQSGARRAGRAGFSSPATSYLHLTRDTRHSSDMRTRYPPCKAPPHLHSVTLPHLFVVLHHGNGISDISWGWYDVWDEKEKAWAYTFTD